MRVHVLGGGAAQLNIIKRIKELGHTVIVSDYLADAPGKDFAHYSSMVSTFDIEGIEEISKWYDADGILTLGTDQPVLTAATCANRLSLPSVLTDEQALIVTHKKIMKRRFTEQGIPTVPWVCIPRDFDPLDLKGIRAPFVMKPLDSQGQRGIFKVDTIEEIRNYFDTTLSFSRDSQILIEQYYPHDELTVSGWVHEGILKVLTITDRITQDTPPSIGVCFAHRYPTKFIEDEVEITTLSEQIVTAIELKEGPIYIQLLKGSDGYLVNEIAARIGGAFEEYIIPAVTGVPVNDLLIDSALGEYRDPLIHYERRALSAYVLFFFARPGKVSSIGNLDDILSIEEVITADYLICEGTQVRKTENATQRAGYVVLCTTPDKIDKILDRVVRQFSIQDQNGCDMIVPFKEFQ